MANGVGSAAGRSKRDQMPRQIRLNAFDMNCVGHQSPGLWTHPRDRADRYNTLDYWVELARILERGKFDALFLADVLGVYDVYRGSPDAAIANAVQAPVNDPLLLIPAMAYLTRNLGFGVTCAVSYEHPYTLARRFSTLDHLTGGRIGWNVVTGYLSTLDWRWLLGAVVLLANWPYTIFVIMPTNRRLMNTPTEAATAETRSMIRWWAFLQAGRSALGLVATLIFLWAQR